ncbi:hypothetical protein AK812_SmicGene36231 [Symbiodinium microadriaticum]|uniref:Uncharacterized protein n=1 Tax=Symbiodinium microadriaticum TaxID=2951 RepID=A0A1Q9CJE9_SYMMI|nr:hypothetical protein AK812_SmicGene36231 [Symbiodinium microadriaticum]
MDGSDDDDDGGVGDDVPVDDDDGDDGDDDVRLALPGVLIATHAPRIYVHSRFPQSAHKSAGLASHEAVDEGKNVCIPSGAPQSLGDFQDPASPQPEDAGGLEAEREITGIDAEADRKFLVSLSATELNELGTTGKSRALQQVLQRGTQYRPDTSNLASILDRLQGIAQESQNTHGFTRENIIQASPVQVSRHGCISTLSARPPALPSQ